MAEFKKNQIVKDHQGNHFRFLKLVKSGKARVESVATKEIFVIPVDRLFESDRVAF